MKNCRSIFIMAICSLSSMTAFAQVCTTQSRGLQFVKADPNVDQATSLVLNECQQNQLTNNGDCSSNLHCDYDLPNPYPSGQLVCITNSHNFGFQSLGSPDDINNLVSTLITQCNQNQFTNNSDCTQNLSCGDASQMSLPYGPSGDLTCETTSAGLHFQMDGNVSSLNDTASGVATQCEQNQVTNNSECTQNLSCRARWNGDDHHDGDGHDGDNHGGGDWHQHDHDFVTCHTQSHSINFSQSGPRSQIDQLTSQVITQCDQNPVTVNNECTQNLSCN